jgi:hypothetical protein
MGAWRSLCGNGNYGDDGEAGSFDQGDRVGVLLHLGDGSLRFFRNVVQQGTEITNKQKKHWPSFSTEKKLQNRSRSVLRTAVVM